MHFHILVIHMDLWTPRTREVDLVLFHHLRRWSSIKPTLDQFLVSATMGDNPQSAKSENLNFHPLEVVSRYREPQLQVGEF